MEENKNIDRLFQEKFKDFEAHPSSRVWNKIAAQQKEKTSRKVIPLWWKLGGIAAAVALLFGLGFTFIPRVMSDSTPLVNKQTDDGQKNFTESSDVRQKSNERINASDFSNNLEVMSNSQSQNIISTKTTVKEEATFKVKIFTPSSTNRVLTLKSDKNSIKEINSYSTTATNSATDKTSSDFFQNSSLEADDISLDDLNNLNTTIASTKVIEGKKDLTIEAQKIKEKQDTEALVQKESTAYKNKWNVGAVAAPVYYGDFGGSGLDKQFADNDKSGDVNVSYGVQISYAVSPKIKVRTGLSSLDLSYSTNEISYSTSGQGRSLRSVNYVDDVATLVITDNTGGNSVENFAPQRQMVGSTSSGALEQRLSYLEIPMEAVYTISDTRVGFSVIGGLSTLLLNDNRVVLRSEDLTTNLGTSTNVNGVSFSTNIGLGIDYKMTDKLQLNLEPSFKYQLNAFDDNAVDFKPYYLGVYTGINYKF